LDAEVNLIKVGTEVTVKVDGVKRKGLVREHTIVRDIYGPPIASPGGPVSETLIIELKPPKPPKPPKREGRICPRPAAHLLFEWDEPE